jgi:drug/metabolite transporter (DMT)-like permease
MFFLSGAFWKTLLDTGRPNYHYIYARAGLSAILLALFIILSWCWYPLRSPWVADLSLLTWVDWLRCLLICFASFWGLYWFTSALQSGKYTIVSTMGSLTSLFAYVAAVLLYTEPVRYQGLGALVLLVIIMMLMHKPGNVSFFRQSQWKALFSAVVWGASFVFYIIPIKQFGVLYFSFILECCVWLSTVSMLLVKEQHVWPSRFPLNHWYILWAMAAIIALGSVLNNLSLTNLPVSVNILLGLLFETFVLIYGIKRLRENLNPREIAIIIMAISAGLLMMIP